MEGKMDKIILNKVGGKRKVKPKSVELVLNGVEKVTKCYDDELKEVFGDCYGDIYVNEEDYNGRINSYKE
jgi:hypothetical protein